MKLLSTKRTTIAASIALLALCFSGAAQTGELKRSVEGIVEHVSDGDTIKVVTNDGTSLKVRLAGMDAPETLKVNHKTGKLNKPGQPYGDNATAFTTNLVLGKKVRLDIYGVDQYKRVLAFVFVDGKNLNLELVKAGLAEVYRGGEYGPYKNELFDAEREARAAKRGMWVLGNDYESPRDFRKRIKIRGQ